MRQSLVWTIALLVAGFAGCAQEEPTLDADDDDHEGHGHDEDHDQDHEVDGNSTALELKAILSADVVNGTAPLRVNFTIDAEGDNATWSIDFGDGNSTEGDSVPAQVNHTFLANSTVTLSVTAGGHTDVTRINVTALAGAVSQAVPETTHWSFGETLGCIEDVESTCQAYADGPGGSGPDGHWIELGQAYWGLELTSTVDKGDVAGTGEWPFYDSDCFFTDADGAVVGEGHNGGGPCATAAIPEGAAWMFLFPYLTPAMGLTVDVIVE